MLLYTNIFKDQMQKVDGSFNFNGLVLYVCFRPFLREFLLTLREHFELIVWTSS